MKHLIIILCSTWNIVYATELKVEPDMECHQSETAAQCIERYDERANRDSYLDCLPNESRQECSDRKSEEYEHAAH